MCWFTSNDGTKLPVGWLVADGSSYSDSIADDYNELFLVIGTTFTPPTDPPGTFRVPDLRGQFIRGWNDAGGNPGTLDPGRAFGTCQVDAYEQHTHAITDPGHIHSITDPGHFHSITDNGHTHTLTDPGHTHSWGVPNAEVVGDTPGFYDGNNKVGNQNRSSASCTTGITIASANTGLTQTNVCVTGITQTLTCTTAISVNNSPVVAPSPNETRPVNLALLPIIKYKES
jgi:microcystin-dependent protein